MIKFGDAMSIFGSDAAAPTADSHKLLKLCKDFTLQSQKHHEQPELEITDATVESVLVHVAALGCSVLQARVDALPAAAVEVEETAADGLSTRATLQEDRNFTARDAELAQVGLVVEAVFTSVAPAPRNVLLLRGHPGLGKSAAAKQGLRLMQNMYAAASCCKDVHVPSIIRGRGAAAVEEDLVRWGRDLGAAIGVGSGAPPETVLSLLKTFLQQARYVVLIDDADEAGLQEALKHLPPSQKRCTLLVTSQMLQQKGVRAYVTAAEAGVAVSSSISVCELEPFSSDECMKLMQSLCPHPPPNPSDKPFPPYAPLYAHEAELLAAFEALIRLPLAVRFFGVWLRGRYHDDMKDAKQKATVAATAFDEAATGATVVQGLLAEWRKTSADVVLAAGAEHSRGLQGTVRLALHVLKSTPHAAACTQLLAMLALCPPVQTPWSLFDGGGAVQAALMTHGRRVVVNGQSICHASVVGENCRIPKLKLEAVAVNDEVKEGGKVSVRLSDGKMINVRGSDLRFAGDAVAEERDGRWTFQLSASPQSRHQAGRIMRQHDDGSFSVLLQAAHEGCHVQLQGLVARADLNGCFGYVCGACDSATQRWPVRVTLSSNDTKDMSLKADNLMPTGKVMARDGNGSMCAVPAFASGWLTAHRPGAEVLRFRREVVQGVRPEAVLPDVTDALGDVAATVSSSGLVDVIQAERRLGMHQLLQQAVRAELGDAHDGTMAALLEARCGCMGDEYGIDQRMYSVMREVVSAAAHVVGRMKAAAPWRAAWACGMRVRVLQLGRIVVGAESLEIRNFYNALDADLSALGEVEGRPAAAEFRAMHWWRRSVRGNERSHQALISEIEAAVKLSPNAATGWDCRVALATSQHFLSTWLDSSGQYDRAIELREHALRIKIATLGEMHASTAVTISNIGKSYSKKGQEDRAIELLERALRIQMATLGEMHAETAITFSSMGSSYSKKGQEDRAIEFFQRALRIEMAQLGEMHAKTAETICNMGTSYSKKGQEDRAIELYERALRIDMATLGEMHASTAETICNMGTSYSKKGQEDRAIELHERALRIKVTTFGEMHASTAETICNMGTSYSKKGQEDRAIEFYQRALRIKVFTLGEMHASTAETIRNMGTAYSKKGQCDRAIELYERALRIQTATLGEMHAATAGTISSMGASYGNKGHYERAIAETERALRICHAALGPHHPQTQQTSQNLANIQLAAADASRAGR
jgi:tetratricopeptide (TPR) repeat protein